MDEVRTEPAFPSCTALQSAVSQAWREDTSAPKLVLFPETGCPQPALLSRATVRVVYARRGAERKPRTGRIYGFLKGAAKEFP
jgi:hypothetical protein